MIEAEIIVVGGGPAGSTCAGRLQQSGREVILLDKQRFPRLKLCAGWITPWVVKVLGIEPACYPHSLVAIERISFHFGPLAVAVPTRQYSIRRIEFDNWLLERAGVPVYEHHVSQIRRESSHYVIDDAFRCRYLVGAGGSNCPVYHGFFRGVNPRARARQIVCLEEEFAYPVRDPGCHLWFFDRGLLGYSWYVPKGEGVVNVGIGGKLKNMQAKGRTIRDYWQEFVAKLDRLELVRSRRFAPKGYLYFLRADVERLQLGQAYLVGDAAGLATRDMGEGIGPGVKSGILAAESILRGQSYSTKSIGKYSLPGILTSRWGRS